MEVFKVIDTWMRRQVLGSKIYPREVDRKRRIVRRDIDMYEYIVESEKNNNDCYSSVFSRWQIANREFDTIFFDIDVHEDGVSVDKLVHLAKKKLDRVLAKLRDYNYRVYATGRGFHVYIDFGLEHLELYGRVVRRWTIEVLGEDKEYVDMKVVGDIRRIARLPMTKNTKVGLWCVPINEEWSVDRILRAMKDYNLAEEAPIIINTELREQLKEMELEMAIEMHKEVKRERTSIDNNVLNAVKEFDIMKLPGCVRDGILNLVKYGELEHYWRVSMSIFLLKLWGFEKTKQLYEMFASDYDERMTTYQLRFLEEKGYYCYSCRKLRDLGYCPYDKFTKCPYYVLTNGWLENLFRRDEEDGDTVNS